MSPSAIDALLARGKDLPTANAYPVEPAADVAALIGPLRTVHEQGRCPTPAALSSYRTVAPPSLGEKEPARSASSTPEVPGHTILRELGFGGMGVVFLARDDRLGRLVAIKMILDASRVRHDTIARFRQEAQALARLQHPGIVQIFDIGEIPPGDGFPAPRPYFSMEYGPGGNLSERLAGKPQSPAESAALVAFLARAVAAAHGRGVIHRDLKPANVLLAHRGKGHIDPDSPGGNQEAQQTRRMEDASSPPSSACEPSIATAAPLAGSIVHLSPKISDFGLARLDQEGGSTRHGEIMGTPSYMAPEQAEGLLDQIGPGVDIYALGAILYECLTGRPPFNSPHWRQTIGLVLTTEPVSPSRLTPGCPRDLETIALHCLRKKPADRYRSAADLADDLDRYLRGEPIHILPVSRTERVVRWARRSPSKALAVLACVALALALSLAAWLQVRAAGQQHTLDKQALAERDRIDEARAECESLVKRATLRAAEAQPGDAAAWTAVEHDTRATLDLLAREPALVADSLASSARQLSEQARDHLDTAQGRAGAVSRLARLRQHHADAVFFAMLAGNLDLAEAPNRALAAAEEGLAEYDAAGAARRPTHATAEEARLIASLCCELRLIEADLLARPRPDEVKEKWHARVRQALGRLDRADSIIAPLRTHVVPRRRGEYLRMLGDINGATRAEKLARETPPTLAVDHFLLGLDQYAADDLATATESLAAALRLQTGHFGAEYLLAVCRLQQNQPSEARDGFTRALLLRPGFPWPRLLRAQAAMQLRRPDDARADIDAVLVSSKDDPLARYVALVNRGALWLERGNWTDAIADFEKAIGANPAALPAYINLAIAHRERAKRFVWPRLRLLSPSDLFAETALAVERGADLDRAIAAIDRALERQPGQARLYHERGRLRLARGHHAGARSDLQRAITLSLPFAAAGRLGSRTGPGATLPEDLLELGRLLHREGKHDEAVKAYEQALAIRPGLTIAHRLMAEPLVALGESRRAGAALDRYLRALVLAGPPADRGGFDRQLIVALQARGILHGQEGNHRAAIDSYSQAIALRRDPEVLLLRGWAYLRLRSPALAETDFVEACRLRPDLGEAFVGLAESLVKQGRDGPALDAVARGIELGPRTHRLLYNAARVHAQVAARIAQQPGAERRQQADSAHRAAARLLAQALLRLPEGKRKAFWTQVIEADPTMTACRREPILAEYCNRYREPETR